MPATVIAARGLGKRYRLGTARAPYGRLTESLSAGIGRLFSPRKRTAESAASEYTWALRDVSFDICQGEVVAIIGRNGAGKTTLLKILSRITDPTEGEARVRGRVGALLEVGAGFHNELTGRENIFLNGAILGMRRAEIQARFEDIVAFSEVERFIDTPVKRYSSGMYLRLAFAVAAHLEPDVLIVDEVLAVGDAAFQKKCLGRMEDVASAGRTVVFVSHNMGAVQSLCHRGLILDAGRVVFDGSASDAVSEYMSRIGSLEAGGEIVWSPQDPNRPVTEDIALHRIAVVAPSGRPQGFHENSAPIRVEIDYEILRSVRGARFQLALRTPEGEVAFKTTDHKMRPDTDSPGRYRSSATIPPNLLNRRNYTVVLSFDIPNVRWILPLRDYLSFTVSGAANHGSDFPEQWDGVVSPIIDWRLERVRSSNGDDAGALMSDRLATDRSDEAR